MDALRESIPPEHGAQAQCFAADLSDAAVPARLIREIHQWAGRIDALVNNAAVASLRPLPQSDEPLFRETLALNTVGPALLIAAVFPIMAHQRTGRIVNVSSVAAHDPFPGFFAYAASKAALESLTRSVHVEGERAGVRAFSVAPGAVETQMLRAAFSEEVLPGNRTLDPSTVADEIVACVLGTRDEQSGRTLLMPSP